MKLEDVILTEEDTERVWKAETKKAGRPSLTTKVWEKALAKAQCLKLLDVLNKKLYEICPHKNYPYERNKLDCPLCFGECMSEIEKLLKEG